MQTDFEVIGKINSVTINLTIKWFLFYFTGFDKYKGGLDTVHDLTGLYSVYTNWRSIEIMFHVSTQLPYEKHDPQKVCWLI